MPLFLSSGVAMADFVGAAADLAVGAAAVAEVAAPAVADDQDQVIRPACADSPDLNGRRWQRMEVRPSNIVIEGGWGGKAPHVAQILEVKQRKTMWGYVHLTKYAAWLVHGAVGPRSQRSDMSAVKIVETLRETFSGPSGGQERR